jgi:HK97 gp10 family phage protein
MAQHKQVRKAVQDAIETALEAVGIYVEGQIIELCPVKSGRLKGSITYATKTNKSNVRSPAKSEDGISHDGSQDTVLIGTNVEYAPYVEYGTGLEGPKNQPIVITPKNKKALFWKGADHPVKKVVSPGMPAQPFLRRGFELTKKEVPEIFAKVIKSKLSKL